MAVGTTTGVKHNPKENLAERVARGHPDESRGQHESSDDKEASNIEDSKHKPGHHQSHESCKSCGSLADKCSCKDCACQVCSSKTRTRKSSSPRSSQPRLRPSCVAADASLQLNGQRREGVQRASVLLVLAAPSAGVRFADPTKTPRIRLRVVAAVKWPRMPPLAIAQRVVALLGTARAQVAYVRSATISR